MGQGFPNLSNLFTITIIFPYLCSICVLIYLYLFEQTPFSFYLTYNCILDIKICENMSFIFRLHFPVKTHENKYQPSENIHPAYAGNHLVCLQVSGWGRIAGVRRITEGKNQGKEHAGKYCCFGKLHSKRVYSMEALAVETELGWGGVFNS